MFSWIIELPWTTIIAFVIPAIAALLKGNAAKKYKAGVEIMVEVVGKLDDKTVARAVKKATTKDGIKSAAGAAISAAVKDLSANVLK